MNEAAVLNQIIILYTPPISLQETFLTTNVEEIILKEMTAKRGALPLEESDMDVTILVVSSPFIDVLIYY